MGMCGEDSQLVSFLRRTSLLQICGFLSAIVGWCLCISATSIGQWRIWHIDKSTQFPSGVMWIGIWDVCYDTNSPDVDYYDINCKPFDAGHAFLPEEIFLAQDLMSLCAVVETLALGFFFLAYWNMIENENERKITLTFFAIGGFLSLTSGIVVLIPVVWNMLSVLNNENINFPESFDMPSNPKFQYVGVAIHLGLASALLQVLSGLIFLSKKCFLIHKKTHPLDCEKGSEITNGEDNEYCPHCGSSLNLATSGQYKRSCEASSDKERQDKPEVTFQIPMGPIPEQRVAHSDAMAFRIVREVPRVQLEITQD